MKNKIEYAVLKRDWTYTNMLGETITFKRGRRFRLNRGDVYFDRNGNLVLRHWYGYGAGEIIEKEYLREKN